MIIIGNESNRKVSKALSSNESHGSIWEYFTQVETPDGISSQCNICQKDGFNKSFKVQKGCSTSGLRRHLQRTHDIDTSNDTVSEANTEPNVDPIQLVNVEAEIKPIVPQPQFEGTYL